MAPSASSEGAAADQERAAGGAPQEPPVTPARITLLLFAAAREAAGTGREEISASTVGEALDEARIRYGDAFTQVLERSRIWLNGDPVDRHRPLREGDELAVLPPVSGG